VRRHHEAHEHRFNSGTVVAVVKETDDASTMVRRSPTVSYLNAARNLDSDDLAAARL